MGIRETGKKELEKWEAAKYRVNLCKMHAAKTILALVRNGTELIKAWLANNGDAAREAMHEASIRKYRENKRDVKNVVAKVKSAMNYLRAEVDASSAGTLGLVLRDSLEADKAYEATRQMAFQLTSAAAACKDQLLKRNNE